MKELLVNKKSLKFYFFIFKEKFSLFIDTQKGFTNKLRSMLKSNFPTENQTLGYFEQNEPDVMRTIKSK